MKTELATITKNENGTSILTLQDGDDEITVPVSAMQKKLKSGATCFVSQKEFRDEHGLGNASAKRLYRAAMNAVGRANRAVMGAIMQDDNLIGTKIHRKSNKKGEFTGYSLELRPKQVVPEKKETAPKDGRGIAAAFRKLSEDERKIALAELGLA